jgi:hypothetical protein
MVKLLLLPCAKAGPCRKEKQLKALTDFVQTPDGGRHHLTKLVQCVSSRPTYVLHMAPLYSESLVFHVGQEIPCCMH